MVKRRGSLRIRRPNVSAHYSIEVGTLAFKAPSVRGKTGIEQYTENMDTFIDTNEL